MRVPQIDVAADPLDHPLSFRTNCDARTCREAFEYPQNGCHIGPLGITLFIRIA
jgi:hypothetical protein